MKQYEIAYFHSSGFHGTLPAGWEPFAHAPAGVLARRRLGWRERVPLRDCLAVQGNSEPISIQTVKVAR